MNLLRVWQEAVVVLVEVKVWLTPPRVSQPSLDDDEHVYEVVEVFQMKQCHRLAIVWESDYQQRGIRRQRGLHKYMHTSKPQIINSLNEWI